MGSRTSASRFKVATFVFLGTRCSVSLTFLVVLPEWLEHNNTSPLTNKRLQSKQLTPNHALRRTIEEWKATRVERLGLRTIPHEDICLVSLRQTKTQNTTEKPQWTSASHQQRKFAKVAQLFVLRICCSMSSTDKGHAAPRLARGRTGRSIAAGGRVASELLFQPPSLLCDVRF